MSPLLLLAAQAITAPAGDLTEAVPPTAFSCDMRAGDGGHFTISGTTPLFPVGSDPNGSLFVPVESSHPDAFRGRVVAITPGHASEWFREFQVTSTAKGDVRYNLNLMLRRDGTSVAYTTRYQSTGKPIPYDYHSAGLCKADFGAAPPAERG